MLRGLQGPLRREINCKLSGRWQNSSTAAVGLMVFAFTGPQESFPSEAQVLALPFKGLTWLDQSHQSVTWLET